MIDAIESWLPLYATGMIESFYNRKPSGNRFRHTLFLCPKKACIAACHPTGMGSQGMYNYFTDSIHLDYFENIFIHLMNDAAPLVSLSQGTMLTSTLEVDPYDSYNSLSLSISSNKVVVFKNSPPQLTMTFTHPLLCNAFQAYVEHRQES